jgi:hypothetical protein
MVASFLANDSLRTSCVQTANGGMCFNKDGSGSFSLGHPGGAFGGSSWNPFGSGGGTSGGLLIGSIGSPDDIAY